MRKKNPVATGAAIILVVILVIVPRERHIGSTTKVAKHYLANTSIKRQKWFLIEGYDVFLTLTDTRFDNFLVLKTVIDSVDIPQDADVYKYLVWNEASESLELISGHKLLNIQPHSIEILYEK